MWGFDKQIITIPVRAHMYQRAMKAVQKCWTFCLCPSEQANNPVRALVSVNPFNIEHVR